MINSSTIISPGLKTKRWEGKGKPVLHPSDQFKHVSEKNREATLALCSDYLQYIKHVRNFSDQTIRSYTYILSSFANTLGCIPIQNLTLEQIDIYMAEFSKDRGHIPSSINTVRCVIRSFFLYVDKYRNIRLQFDYSHIRQIKAPRSPVVVVSPDEVKRMISKLQTPQDKVMMLTMYSTGMRIGELIKICVEDFYGDRLTVKGKGGKLRTVPLDSELAQILLGYIRANNILTGPIFKHQVVKSAYSYGAMYTVSGLRKRWQRQLEPRGLYKKPHSLRHGIATQLMMAGMDIRTLQTFLGHSHIATTMLYTHVTDKHLEESYKKYFGSIGFSPNDTLKVIDNE